MEEFEETTVPVERVVRKFFENAACVRQLWGPPKMKKEYDEDDIRDVADLIKHRFGIEEFEEILGVGAYGVAAIPVDPYKGFRSTDPAQMRFAGFPRPGRLLPRGVDYVFKLTCDVEEVSAATNLIGKRHKHVATFYGAYFLSDFTVPHQATARIIRSVNLDVPQNAHHLRIGVTLSEWLPFVGVDREGRVGSSVAERYNTIVGSTKDKFRVWPTDLIVVSRTTARQRLKRAQEYLIEKLIRVAEEAKPGSHYRVLASEIAFGLQELKDSKIYAVDVHTGNIGYTDRTGPRGYKIFDVGVSSSPRTKRTVVLKNPADNPAIPILMNPWDRWPFVPVSPQVNPIQVLE